MLWIRYFLLHGHLLSNTLWDSGFSEWVSNNDSRILSLFILLINENEGVVMTIAIIVS